MKLPKLLTIKTSKDIVNQFAGINNTETCGQNEFRKAYNLTADSFPMMATRSRRRLSGQSDIIRGIFGGDRLYIITDSHMSVLNEVNERMYQKEFTADEKCIVKMGSKVCIFPDKVVFDTETETFEDIEIHNQSSGSVSFSLTNINGDAITYHDAAYYEKNAPLNGNYLLENDDGVDVLKQYNSTTGAWTIVTKACMLITSTGIGRNLHEGDGVKISVDLSNREWSEGKNIFPSTDGDNVYYNTFVIRKATENSIAVYSILKNNVTFTNVPTKADRNCPDMKYVCECNNRLWGCNEKGTEIYASALGDPKNWNCFEGISTDSWAVTIGSEGKFTGAITYLGYPTFFKENLLIKVAISSNGAHQTKETVCRGVAEGSGKSLVVMNEVLYYKSASDICYYDGSLPMTLSERLGDLTEFNNVAAGVYKNTLYMANSEHCYTYADKKGIWYETDDRCDLFASMKGVLVGAKNRSLTMWEPLTSRSGIEEENKDIKWAAESGAIYYATTNSKYVYSLTFRTELEFNSTINIYIKYDNEKEWQRVYNISGTGMRVHPISLAPKRCDRFFIKLEGKGGAKVSAIVKNLAEGSDYY